MFLFVDTYILVECSMVEREYSLFDGEFDGIVFGLLLTDGFPLYTTVAKN